MILTEGDTYPSLKELTTIIVHSLFCLPEIVGQSRVLVLMYMQARSPIAHLLKRNLLKLIDVVVEQDTRILSRIYPNTPQRIKLNNEVGMDWVRRNFEQFSTMKSAVLPQPNCNTT